MCMMIGVSVCMCIPMMGFVDMYVYMDMYGSYVCM